MDRKSLKELEAFFKKLEEPKAEKVIMFGSRAGEDYLLNSDLDIILVSKDFQGIPFPQRGIDLFLKWKGSAPIELLCYTPEEFEKKKRQIGLVADAVSKGIEIKLS